MVLKGLRNQKEQNLFKIIPYRRPSTSLGFSQAVDKTWDLYKKENNKPAALRIRFQEAPPILWGGIFGKQIKLIKFLLPIQEICI